MPKWLIGVLIFLGIVLVGVNAYLFYSYFSFKKTTETLPSFQPSTIEAEGEIKPGWQLPQTSGYCAKSYYLVSGAGIIEIRPLKNLTPDSPVDFKRYANAVVNITGVTHPEDSLSCGEFTEVKTLGNLGADPEPIIVEGVISCLPGSIESEDGCIQALQIGDAYIAVIKDEAVLENFGIGDRLHITGTTDNTFDSPEKFDGAIRVTTLEKI